MDLVAAARAADLFTTPYVFSAADARARTRAGADIVVCLMGLTGGTTGAEKTKTERLPTEKALTEQPRMFKTQLSRADVHVSEGGP